jgi:PAS domain S-box-containing protein
MPRRSAAQARAVKRETDILVDRVRTALAESGLAPATAGILTDVLAGLECLQAAEERLMDLTERLAESDAVIRSERERYRRLFEGAPDGYVVTDGDGRIKEANGRARLALRTAGTPVEGARLDTFFEGEERQLIWSVLGDLAGGVRVDPFEVALAGEPDAPSTIEVHVDAEASSSSEPADVRWMLRDITDRLRLEREVQQLHADVGLLTAFAEVSRLVTHTDDPTETLLQGLVELATADQPGARAAILLTDERGALRARAVSDPVAAELCAVEAEHGGPASEAIAAGQPVLCQVRDLHRWPELATEVERHGLAWVLAQPIGDQGMLGGALAVYGTGPSESAERVPALLAEHAAATIANRELYMSTRRLAGHLETALHTRAVIEQAKGILMGRQGCDADTAFDVLRRASQRQNRKLHDVAEDLVAATSEPGDPAAPAAR